jgi:DNA mismatch repair ATPase MutS
MIYEIIDPSVIYVHGVKQEQQIVMAIRPGLNAVLDAARKIYEETEREARQLVERYREQHQIEDLKMTYTSKRYEHCPSSINRKLTNKRTYEIQQWLLFEFSSHFSRSQWVLQYRPLDKEDVRFVLT